MTQALVFGAFALLIGIHSPVLAQELPAGTIYRQGTEVVTLEQALAQVQPGTVVVLGEEHGTVDQASQQVQVLETLRQNGHIVSVGMEFFERPQQALVDAWRAGTLIEADFLQQIGWGGFPFASYREQSLFPKAEEGATTLALNVSRKITSKIAKTGVESLTADERAQLPADFTIGNDRYLARFKDAMGGHVPEAALGRYFAAQSAWDDSMALAAANYLSANPRQVLVITVGEFHSGYGGGLPDRLKARGQKVTTFSLVNLAGLSAEEQKQAVEPTAVDGARADFVWTSRIERTHN